MNKYDISENVCVKLNGVEGKIIDSCRYFKEVNNNNEFIKGGHGILESTLDDFKLPYRLIGDILSVDKSGDYCVLDKKFNVPMVMRYKIKDIAYIVEFLNNDQRLFLGDELQLI